MKLFRFDRAIGAPIAAFGSANVVIARLARLTGGAQIGCVNLGPGGRIGARQAASAQLFAAVQGSGWVLGGDAERLPIQAGLAAFWNAGEWHATTTESGLVAIVIESDALEPAGFLPPA